MVPTGDNLKQRRKNMLPAKEIMKSYEDVIKLMKTKKNVKGFIVLVDDTYGEKKKGETSKGLNACCGDLGTLANLVSNIPEDILEDYEHKKALKDALSGLKSFFDKIGLGEENCKNKTEEIKQPKKEEKKVVKKKSEKKVVKKK